jgi:hypothetical protein
MKKADGDAKAVKKVSALFFLFARPRRALALAI